MNNFKLAFVLIVMGINWTLLKIGMNYIPPLWFGFSRLVIGSLFLFALLIIQKKFTFPKRGDLSHILSVGILQFGFFTVFLTLGLFYNSVDNTVILVYTTPLWVAPIAIIFFKERLNLIKAVGLIIGLLGLISFFNPLEFDWSDQKALMGSIGLLLAAILWAISILHIRFSPSQSSILILMPWQLLLGAIIVLFNALIIEPYPVINLTPFAIFLALYIGTIGTGLAFWGLVEISKYFPAVTTSLLLTAIPVVGVIGSLIFLGEKLTMHILISLTMIIISIICLIVGSYHEKKYK